MLSAATLERREEERARERERDDVLKFFFCTTTQDYTLQAGLQHTKEV